MLFVNKINCENYHNIRIRKKRGISRILAALHLFYFHVSENERNIINFFNILFNLKKGILDYVVNYCMLLHVPDPGWGGIFYEVFTMKIYDIDYKKKQPLILDIGAHLGFSIIYFKNIFPHSIVHGYEPNSIIFPALVENLIHNCSMNNIFLYNTSVSTTDKDRILFYKKNDYTEGSLVDSSLKKEEKMLVKSRNFKKILSSFKTVDILKIDAEGIEYDLIPEIIKNRKKIKVFIIEFHPNIYKSNIKDISRLGKYYRLYIRNNPFFVDTVNNFFQDNTKGCNPFVLYGKLLE